MRLPHRLIKFLISHHTRTRRIIMTIDKAMAAAFLSSSFPGEWGDVSWVLVGIYGDAISFLGIRYDDNHDVVEATEFTFTCTREH
jgi:hypothetical protein